MSKKASVITRFTNFVKEVWAEVNPKTGRVTWPTYDTVKAYTFMVIVGTMMASAFIGLVDLFFSRMVMYLLKV
ncbi:MAG: preprotein translocase subunit SecE [Candidatus Riflebacteria bacterium]|nr:preprotein translocase subunit SecE [Candidatus Riflebacteria bacterium]